MIRLVINKVSKSRALLDVIDRILDKGITFDSWVRSSLIGIDLSTTGTHVYVESIDTYLNALDPSRVLFIVSADETTLFEVIRRTFVSSINVVLDRRRRERRDRSKSVISERRLRERRVHDPGPELESMGIAVVMR